MMLLRSCCAVALLSLSFLLLLAPTTALIRNSAPAVSLNGVTVNSPITSFLTASIDGTFEALRTTPYIPYFPSVYSGRPLPESDQPDFSVILPVLTPHHLDDPTGCSGPWQKQDEYNRTFEDAWVMMLSSSCSEQRFINAAASGARGLIVYNCDPALGCEIAIQSVSIRLTALNLTVVAMSFIDGDSIRNWLDALKGHMIDPKNPLGGPPREAMVLTAISSGKIVPEERAALIQIASKTTMKPYAASHDVLPLWSVERFSDPTWDPCRNRTKGIWCEGNNIVIIVMPQQSWATPNGIPSEFGAFSQLRYLAAHNNEWTGPLPQSFCNLTNLIGLRVSHQLVSPFITALPDCNFERMEELTVFSNSITSLPTKLGSWKQLTFLRAASNRLTNLPSLTDLNSLQILDLAQNALTEIPDLSPLAHVEVISLASNNITGTLNMTKLKQMTNTNVLDLNSNRLSGTLPTFLVLLDNGGGKGDGGSGSDSSSSTGGTNPKDTGNGTDTTGTNTTDTTNSTDTTNGTDTSGGKGKFTTDLPPYPYHPTSYQSKIGVYNSYNGGATTVDTILPLKMQVLDLSSQRDMTDSKSTGFTGAIPVEWKKTLPDLVTLNLQENSLELGQASLSAFPYLTDCDLSFNNFTNPPLPNYPNGEIGSLLNQLIGPAMKTLRLNSNKLTGVMAFSDPTSFQVLQKLYLQNNNISTLWAEVFSLPTLTTLDMSYNQLTSVDSTFNRDVPPSSFELLNLVGNPNFRLKASDLSWLQVKPSRVQLTGSKFICSALGSNTALDMIFSVDPSLFDYAFCDCEAGNFGKAPICSPVPSTADLNPFSVISSTEVGGTFATQIEETGGVGGNLTTSATTNATESYIPPENSKLYAQAFSDAMYGDSGRLTQGISTSWVMKVSNLYAEDSDPYIARGETPPESTKQVHIVDDPSSVQAGWTPVRVLTVRLHISATTFTSFDDVLSVYAGGSDLKGERMFTMRGNDDKQVLQIDSEYTKTPAYQSLYGASLAKIADARLVEIPVFSSIATVQFTSRQSGGLHFFATYSYDFSCPVGYFYNTVTDPSSPKCRLNYLIYKVDSGIRSAVFAVSAVALALVTFTLLILLLNWNHSVFKAASRAFMLLILVLMEAMALGAMLYAAIPDVGTASGDAVCAGRAWLTCLPLAGVMGVMLAKNRRMWAIFGATKLEVKVHSDMDLLITVLIICSLQAVLLAIFTGLPLSKSLLALGKDNLSDRLVISCSQETGFMSWVGAEIAFIGVLMIPSAYLGFKTRNLPSQFNESSHLQNALIILMFFIVIIIPLAVFVQNSPESSVLIQGLGLAFCCITLTGIIFGPKLYYCYASKRKGGSSGLSFNPTMSAGDTQTHTGDTKGSSSGSNQGRGVTPTPGASGGSSGKKDSGLPSQRQPVSSLALPKTRGPSGTVTTHHTRQDSSHNHSNATTTTTTTAASPSPSASTAGILVSPTPVFRQKPSAPSNTNSQTASPEGGQRALPAVSVHLDANNPAAAAPVTPQADPLSSPSNNDIVMIELSEIEPKVVQ